MFTRRIILLLVVVILNIINLNYGYEIPMPTLELLDNMFLVSISDAPDIKGVDIYVNVNKQLESGERPQLACSVAFPKDRRWTCEFPERLLDSDVLYMGIIVMHNQFSYREKKGGFSVGAIRRGDPNFIITTTAKTPVMEPSSAAVPRIETSSASVPRLPCNASITEISNGGKLCQGDLIFEDNFDEFPLKNWTDEIRIPTTGIDAEFSFYNGSVSVNEGILKIEASVYAADAAKGILDLRERCTSNDEKECYFNIRNSFYPPIASGRINTKGKFQFKYGRIEVKAKMPIGDWLFPLILLQSAEEKYGQDDYANGEMRIAFLRGNEDIPWNNTNIGGKRLFGGVILDKKAENRTRYMANVTLADVNGVKEHFGREFHIYSMTWTPDELLLSVDGFEYGKMAADFRNSLKTRTWKRGSPANAPLNQMFYITLGLAVGGHADFPDKIPNKTWQNTSPKAILHFFNDRNTWKQTWIQPTLEVEYVRVYAV